MHCSNNTQQASTLSCSHFKAWQLQTNAHGSLDLLQLELKGPVFILHGTVMRSVYMKYNINCSIKSLNIKAALINIFRLQLGQITACNVKLVVINQQKTGVRLCSLSQLCRVLPAAHCFVILRPLTLKKQKEHQKQNHSTA